MMRLQIAPNCSVGICHQIKFDLSDHELLLLVDVHKQQRNRIYRFLYDPVPGSFRAASTELRPLKPGDRRDVFCLEIVKWIYPAKACLPPREFRSLMFQVTKSPIRMCFGIQEEIDEIARSQLTPRRLVDLVRIANDCAVGFDIGFTRINGCYHQHQYHRRGIDLDEEMLDRLMTRPHPIDV
jgi:hypothetical protein